MSCATISRSVSMSASVPKFTRRKPTGEDATTPVGHRIGERLLVEGAVVEERLTLFDEFDEAGVLVLEHRDGRTTARLGHDVDERDELVELDYATGGDGADRWFRLADPDTGDYQDFDAATHRAVRQCFGLTSSESDEPWGRVWRDMRTGDVLLTDGLGRIHRGRGQVDDDGLVTVTLPALDGHVVVDPQDGVVHEDRTSPAVHLAPSSQQSAPQWSFDRDVDYAPAESWSAEWAATADGELVQLSADGRWWRRTHDRWSGCSGRCRLPARWGRGRSPRGWCRP